jgi:ribosome-associated protein
MSEPAPSSDSGLELAPGVRAAAAGVRFQFARSGGPGGQNVNKLNTKAELWVPVAALQGLSLRAAARLRAAAGRRLTRDDEIHIAAESERSQEANRQAALARLRELIIAAQHEPKVRRKTKPSRGAKLRRLESKRRRSDIKANRRGAGDA